MDKKVILLYFGLGLLAVAFIFNKTIVEMVFGCLFAFLWLSTELDMDKLKKRVSMLELEMDELKKRVLMLESKK